MCPYLSKRVAIDFLRDSVVTTCLARAHLREQYLFLLSLGWKSCKQFPQEISIRYLFQAMFPFLNPLLFALPILHLLNTTFLHLWEQYFWVLVRFVYSLPQTIHFLVLMVFTPLILTYFQRTFKLCGCSRADSIIFVTFHIRANTFLVDSACRHAVRTISLLVMSTPYIVSTRVFKPSLGIVSYY